VTVRVVERSEPETLLAVFQGKLGVLSHAKHPALFRPVYPFARRKSADADEADTHLQSDGFHVEACGFYLRGDRFRGGVARAGCNVLVIVQGPALINIRQT